MEAGGGRGVEVEGEGVLSLRSACKASVLVRCSLAITTIRTVLFGRLRTVCVRCWVLLYDAV